MNHNAEIAAGRLIEPGTITPYLCWSNHLMLVVGPHVFCKCNGARKGRVLQKPQDHCGCPEGIKKQGYHLHIDGTEGYFIHSMVHLWCNCQADTKAVAKIPKATLRAATAAYAMHGYHAAIALLEGPGKPVYPPMRSSTYKHPLPDDFPPGR